LDGDLSVDWIPGANRLVVREPRLRAVGVKQASTFGGNRHDLRLKSIVSIAQVEELIEILVILSQLFSNRCQPLGGGNFLAPHGLNTEQLGTHERQAQHGKAGSEPIQRWSSPVLPAHKVGELVAAGTQSAPKTPKLPNFCCRTLIVYSIGRYLHERLLLY